MATNVQKEVLTHWFNTRLEFHPDSVLSMNELYEMYCNDIRIGEDLTYNSLAVKPRAFFSALKKYAANLENPELIIFYYRHGSKIQGWRCASNISIALLACIADAFA